MPVRPSEQVLISTASRMKAETYRTDGAGGIGVVTACRQPPQPGGLVAAFRLQSEAEVVPPCAVLRRRRTAGTGPGLSDPRGPSRRPPAACGALRRRSSTPLAAR